jgi:transposase
MFIRIKKKSETRYSIQIVESIREGTTIKQKLVRHIGVAHAEHEIAGLEKLANLIKAQIEEERQPRLFTPEQVAALTPTPSELKAHKIKCETQHQMLQPSLSQNQKNGLDTLHVDLKQIEEEARHIVGIHDVYGKVFDELKFNTILGTPVRKKHAHHVLKQLVLARIANPSSKRDAVIRLEEDFGISLNLDNVYDTMDQLDDKAIQKLQEHTLNVTKTLCQGKIDVVFYDCTTLYFESFEEDDLRKNGYSKDLKFNQPQVVLALMVTKDGLPIGYDVFPGNTYEGHTLVPALNQLKEKFNLDKVVFVADSGLLNAENLTFLKEQKFHYIVGARIKNVKKEVQEMILDASTYTVDAEDGTLRYGTFEWSDQDQLIVQHSDKRAFKDREDRLKAIEKMRKKLQKNKKDPKEFLSNHGYKKYLTIEGTTKIALNEERIAEDAKWDGLHGVITNIDWLTPAEIKAQYTGLWQVEESFRINKHDLKVRPIFHWKEKRVKAHLALCYMAFSCVRYLEYRVKTQYQKLSPEVIRRELLHVQQTVLRHKQTEERFIIPSKMGIHAARIYRVMNMRKNTLPFKVLDSG